MGLKSQTALMSSYRYWSLLFLTAERAEHKIRMNRSVSGKKGTMYVQKTVRRASTTKIRLATGARGSRVDKKEKKIVLENKLATYLTVREKRKTVMSKPIKEMAFACFIYKVDFKNLAEKNNLNLEEDQSGRVQLFLATFSYNVKRDQKGLRTEYDVFSSNDKCDVAKILEHVVRPGSHVLNVWYALRFCMY